MNRLKTIFISVLLILSVLGCGKAVTDGWQEQYDLGMRYLTEGNYEEAILAFTAAIEIDPKLPEAYIGRGDAYAALEDFEKALADYEKAEELGAEGIDKKLEQIRVLLESHGLLSELYDVLQSGDTEHAKELMRQEEYTNLTTRLSDESVCFNGGEKMLAAYADNYYYFGQWEDAQRSGEGLWIKAVFENPRNESKIYSGMWKDDKPNGTGSITEIYNVDASQLEEGYTTAVRIETEATIVGGLLDGIVHETWYMNDGSTHIWTITAVNGTYQSLGEVDEDGSYLVSYDQIEPDAALWEHPDDVNGVFGFVE